MSRAGYSDDCDDTWGMIRWRGAAASAIRGKRGQAFLSELLTVLDAMQAKELASETLAAEGQFCTIGALMHSRGMTISDGEMHWGSPDEIAVKLDSTHALVAEIIAHNDHEYCWLVPETSAARWTRMREWIAGKIKVQS